MFTQSCYHALMLLVDLLLLRSIWRSAYTSFMRFCLLACLGAFAAVFGAAVLTELFEGRFGANVVLIGLAWHGSFFLFASVFLMYRQKRHDGKPRCRLPSLMAVFGCVYSGLALDALLIEPTGLLVQEITIPTSKITKPMTLVFCSDIQTDGVGSYERWTLQKMKEQHADVILFGGDYVQGSTFQETQQLRRDLNRVLQEVDLQAPLGIYAVQGNVGGWTGLFDHTAVIPMMRTRTKSIGEIRITFLSLRDSGTSCPIPDEDREEQFRIIVGHKPIYATAAQEADLLLAGHTHGGQVQIPFVGPLLTNSGNLPKRWASGKTLLPNGATLIVSHGTGLERGRAPRVRFWCRPDFWVIRLVPEKEG